MELKEGVKVLRTNVKGKNNFLELPNESINYDLNIKINGSNNKIIIGNSANLKKVTFEIEGNDNLIRIGDKCRILNGKIATHRNAKIVLGNETSIREALLLAKDGKQIEIGQDCMFSTGIKLRTTDSHPMLDAVTKERVNLDDDIHIGNHVWVGMDVTILKGTVIPDGCIVGASSVINRKFDQKNCVIAGFPAQIVKTGVTWDR